MYQAIADWDGAHGSVSLSGPQSACKLWQTGVDELCCAAAEGAELQQQQAHRDLAELMGQLGTGQNAVNVAVARALPKHRLALRFILSIQRSWLLWWLGSKLAMQHVWWLADGETCTSSAEPVCLLQSKLVSCAYVLRP